MLGLDRSRRAGRHLEWRVRIFTVGAVLGVVGIFLDDRRLTGAAIVVLLGGFVLRFLPGMDSAEDGPEGGGWEGSAPERSPRAAPGTADGAGHSEDERPSG